MLGGAPEEIDARPAATPRRRRGDRIEARRREGERRKRSTLGSRAAPPPRRRRRRARGAGDHRTTSSRFHATGEWRYGRKVLSALGALAAPRAMPEELTHDLELLRKLEAALDDPLAPPPGGADVPDDDLPELAICLREEIENLRGSVDEARRQVAALEAQAAGDAPPPPAATPGRRDLPPAPPG